MMNARYEGENNKERIKRGEIFEYCSTILSSIRSSLFSNPTSNGEFSTPWLLFPSTSLLAKAAIPSTESPLTDYPNRSPFPREDNRVGL